MMKPGLKKGPATRAAEALRSTLAQVSAIHLKEIQFAAPEPGCTIDILAHIEVYGHKHTLACKMAPGKFSARLRNALLDLCEYASRLVPHATPVFIAPFLSQEAQALCREYEACFLDMEGNARLVLGDVFFAKRSVSRRDSNRRSVSADKLQERGVLNGFPPASSIISAASLRTKMLG